MCKAETIAMKLHFHAIARKICFGRFVCISILYSKCDMKSRKHMYWLIVKICCPLIDFNVLHLNKEKIVTTKRKERNASLLKMEPF